MLYGIKLPEQYTLMEFEGKGPWAIGKYYQFPWNLVYLYKLRMIVRLMDKKVARTLLDLGSGPGIFKPELQRRALRTTHVNHIAEVDPRAKFDVIVCASYLEFVKLSYVLPRLDEMLAPGGQLVIASPMKSWVTRAYYHLLGDTTKRHSHEEILSMVSKHFRVEKYTTWLGIYFAIKARKR